MGYHPRKEGSWVNATNGVYELNDEFYKTSGDFFDPMQHYEEIFAAKVSELPGFHTSGAAFKFTDTGEVEQRLCDLKKIQIHKLDI